MAISSWFTVLGPVRVWQAGTELDVGSPQQRAVLAALLLRHGTPVCAEDMIDALWDEDVPGAAASTVRTYISRLRRTLGDDVAIRSVAGGYQLDLSTGELDLAVFRRNVADAEHARRLGDVATWRNELVKGLDLWHGPPLAGLPGPFACWQRTSLERLRASTQIMLLRGELDLGEPDRVLPELAALVDEHPLDEQLRELLITGLYRAGRQADALAAYQDTRSLLASELGIDPGPALRTLHERILRADATLLPALESAGLPGGHNPSRDNLPAQVSSFIGRDRELADVRALVAESRLVTLTGAGGAGKTRLGLQVAYGLAGDAEGAGDGVWFADLAPLRDPDLVAATVADVLGVRRDPGRTVLETVLDAVGERSLLLLLDNCEHVIGTCAALADALLRGCPNLAVLATSREPLCIGGERVYRVPSMDVPADEADPGEIRVSEAVRLLEDRAAAQGVRLNWDEETARVAARICKRLDGMPLAIELAAARLRAIPAAELEARLDERFALLTGGSRAALARHQTLKATVDWSWELLTGAMREVLARLSVFAGGFGLTAAEVVAAGPGVPATEVLGLLGSLVDKSLVQFGDAAGGPGRYRLLETVRQYAADQLRALGTEVAEAARIAHRDYYLILAEEVGPHFRVADQAAWLDRLDAELGNLRAAIAFSLTQADPEPGLRLAAPLRVYWQRRGLAAEGADALRALLEMPAAQAPTPLRARALAAAAHLLGQTNGYVTAGDYSREALAIAGAADDDSLVGDVLQTHAWMLVRQGQQDAALPLIGRGLGLARRLGQPHLTARLLFTRAHAVYVAGDHEGAARDAEQSARLFRQVGDRIQLAGALGNLGNYELAADDLDAARRHLAESLDIARAFNDRFAIWGDTFNLGLVEYLGGSLGAAEELFAESHDLARRTGMRSQVAYALIGLALTAQRGADPYQSARLHGAADQAFADLGLSVEPLEGRLAELDRQRLRAVLGDGVFDAEYTEGRDRRGVLTTFR